MIKNIINHKGVFGLLFSFALSTSRFVFTGCSRFEENDSFDESAALRIAKPHIHFKYSSRQDSLYSIFCVSIRGSNSDCKGMIFL